MTSTAASRTAAAGVLALLMLGCATEPPPTEPIAGPGQLTAESAKMPPELPPESDGTADLTPPGGQRPPRYERVRGPADLPPPPPPAPVFTPPPPSPNPGQARAEPGLREVFPNVRIDPAAGIVEFDGTIAWDVHDPRTPMTYLELVVCTPDTKEHESLVVSKARPSNVHAALLLLGLEPGKPGSFTWEGERLVPIDPEGPPVDVRFVLDAGTEREKVVDPLTWIVNAKDGQSFAEREGDPSRPGFLFAGSRIVKRDLGEGEREYYLADGSDGALVGLTTFGSETIAWRRTISPDSSVTEPEWIANVAQVPPVGTPVVVRISALPAASTQPQPDSGPATHAAP